MREGKVKPKRAISLEMTEEAQQRHNRAHQRQSRTLAHSRGNRKEVCEEGEKVEGCKALGKQGVVRDSVCGVQCCVHGVQAAQGGVEGGAGQGFGGLKVQVLLQYSHAIVLCEKKDCTS